MLWVMAAWRCLLNLIAAGCAAGGGLNGCDADRTAKPAPAPGISTPETTGAAPVSVAAAPPVPPAAPPAAWPARVTLTEGPPWLAASGERAIAPGPTARLRPPKPVAGPVPREPAAATAADRAAAVPWDRAHLRAGERVTVVGRVVHTHHARSGVCFLNFAADWRGRFYVPVFRDAWASLPAPPAGYFLNRTVYVTGTVGRHKGVPQIAVRDLKQIRLAPPPAPAPASAPER